MSAATSSHPVPGERVSDVAYPAPAECNYARKLKSAGKSAKRRAAKAAAKAVVTKAASGRKAESARNTTKCQRVTYDYDTAGEVEDNVIFADGFETGRRLHHLGAPSEGVQLRFFTFGGLVRHFTGFVDGWGNYNRWDASDECSSDDYYSDSDSVHDDGCWGDDPVK